MLHVFRLTDLLLCLTGISRMACHVHVFMMFIFSDGRPAAKCDEGLKTL